jgi:hypothetical protein
MSRLVPDTRNARRVSGTKKVVVHERVAGGMKKIRCPTSHQIAVPSRAGDGSTVLKTQNGTTYVTRPLK